MKSGLHSKSFVFNFWTAPFFFIYLLDIDKNHTIILE